YFRRLRGITPFTVSIPPARSGDYVASVFRQMSDWIETSARSQGSDLSLRGALAIVDYFDERALDLSEINPLSTRQQFAAVFGMLALSFPEIHWVITGPIREDGYGILRGAHSLIDSKSLKNLMEIRDAGY